MGARPLRLPALQADDVAANFPHDSGDGVEIYMRVQAGADGQDPGDDPRQQRPAHGQQVSRENDRRVQQRRRRSADGSVQRKRRWSKDAA